MIDEIRAALDGVQPVTMAEARTAARRRRRRVRTVGVVASLVAMLGVVGAVLVAQRSSTQSARVAIGNLRCNPSLASPGPPPTAPTHNPSSPSSSPASSPVTNKPVLGTYAEAVNIIGRRFPAIFAAADSKRGGAVSLYIGPGSDAALLAALACIEPAGISDAPSPGKLPSLDVIRVPASAAEVDRQAQALEDAGPSLEAMGYRFVHVSPHPERGEVEVKFHAVPAGISTASATRYLDSTIAPNIVVTSINASYPTFG